MPAEHYKVNSPAVLAEVLDGEVVVVNLESGVYFSIEKSGASIWRKIQQGVALSQIINELVRAHQMSQSEVESQVHTFVLSLQDAALILECTVQDIPQCGVAAEIPIASSFEGCSLRQFTDLQEILVLDPIHEVDEAGWPQEKKK